MPQTNSEIHNRKAGQIQDKRVMFVLHQELLDQIREVADANHVSVSQFLRDSARRSIAAYRKAGQ
jgi:mannitol-specific phosphotransferase system IIBC component